VIIAADSDFPQIADITAPFVYVRLMGTSEAHAAGYPDAALDKWAENARVWAAGKIPGGLQNVSNNPNIRAPSPRDVFIYLISGYKGHNPAAAMALIERLG
jgi:uncharacterized protein YecE (DUF72 family)